MGHQIVKQPDGKLAIFSDGVDYGCWLRWDMTPDEVVEWFAERAAESQRSSARRQVDLVLADSSYAYGRYGETFAYLNATSKATGHHVLDGPVDEERLAEMTAFITGLHK